MLVTSAAGVQVQVQNCCFFHFLFVGDVRYINKYFFNTEPLVGLIHFRREKENEGLLPQNW